MSYIRYGDRRWTEGRSFRAFSHTNGSITSQGRWSVPTDEYLEVTMRILERGEFDEEDLEEIFEVLKEETYFGQMREALEEENQPPERA